MDSTLPEKSVAEGLLAAVFPEICLQCGVRVSRRLFFCGDCLREGVLKSGGFTPGEGGLNRKYAFLYEGPGKSLFAAAKFSGRRRAIRFFMRAAQPDLAALGAGAALVLALPSRKTFLRRMLQANVPKQQLILDAFCVRRTFFRKDANKLLGEAQRYRRIHEDLLWNNPAMPKAERYVLCDDVSTTGATLNHAAHLLQTNLGIQKSQITLWSLMYRERVFAPGA